MFVIITRKFKSKVYNIYQGQPLSVVFVETRRQYELLKEKLLCIARILITETPLSVCPCITRMHLVNRDGYVIVTRKIISFQYYHKYKDTRRRILRMLGLYENIFEMILKCIFISTRNNCNTNFKI